MQRQNLQTPFVIKAPQPSSSKSMIIHDVQIHKPPQNNDIQAVTEEEEETSYIYEIEQVEPNNEYQNLFNTITYDDV